MRFAEIISPSLVDGPGERAALFVQGCSIHCPGCQNRHLWEPTGGYLASPHALAEILVETGLPITISGGEPFEQPDQLDALLDTIRWMDPNRHIIVYTGYTLKRLIRTGRYSIYSALVQIDVLVDGPYIRELDAPGMQYRGSSNQRVIDLQATVRQPYFDLYEHGPILLDWDTPELILTEDGDLLGATPVVAEFAGVGQVEATRRCGETDRTVQEQPAKI